MYATHYFRPYLYGRQFTLITDHKPLVWLHNVKDPTSRLLRWRIKLEEYEYKIVYKQGKANSNADALSRNPIEKRDEEIKEEFAINVITHKPDNGEPISSRLRTRNKRIEYFPQKVRTKILKETC